MERPMVPDDDPFSVVEPDTQLENICKFRYNISATRHRLTSIGVTIGQTSRSVDVLQQMVMEGMDVARINFSHDSHEHHKQTIDNLRTAVEISSKRLGYQLHVAIAVDLKGAEIRTGSLENNVREVELRKNDNIRLSINKDLIDKGTREVVFVDYWNIINVMEPGNRILLNDGAILVVVKEVAVDCIVCQVVIGGMLGSRKSVDIPGVTLDLPPVSEKDRYDLKFAVDNSVDLVIVSKIRTAETVTEVRSLLGIKGKDIRILAKIENLQALDVLDEILAASDGLFLSRVDLGVELKQAKVFLVQKALIARCNRIGKPIICAGQLLESMMKRWAPSRAEVADLGNAVLDGADCVLLSSESAIGAYPVHVVRETATVCREAEMALWYRNLFKDLVSRNPAVIDAAHAIAIAAVDASRKALAAVIVVITTSGRSAQLVSKYRPRCPIIAVTRCGRAARQCALYRGVIAALYGKAPLDPWTSDVDARVKFALQLARRMTLIKMGDAVIVVSPWKEGVGFTNNVRILYAFFETENFECLLKNDREMSLRIEKQSSPP